MTFFLTTANFKSINKPTVIDASFAYNLIAPTPLRAQLQKQVTQWQRNGHTLCAPTLWVYEITSTFCKMVRFGQLTEANAQSSIALVYKLGVQLIPPDEALAKKAYEWTRRLNRGAAYDSFYLASVSCPKHPNCVRTCRWKAPALCRREAAYS